MANKKFQLSNVLTVSLAHMIHDTFTAFLAPLLPLLKEKLGISYALAGILSAIQKSPAFFYPVVGIIADKMSLRFLVILGPTFTATAMSLLGVAPNIFSLIVILLVTGTSSTLFHVPSPVLIKQVAGDKTGLGMSFYMLGGELARTIGPLLVLGAVSLWGLEGTYKLIPIGVIASIVLFLRFRKMSIPKSDKKEKEKPHDTLKKLRNFMIFIGAFSFFREIMKASLTLFLPAYVKSTGGSIWFGGISLSILQFAGAMGTMTSGHLSDKIGRRKTLLFIAFSMPVVMILFSFSEGIMMIPSLVLLGFVAFASNPVLLATIQDTNSENPAFLNSIYMTMSFFVSAIVTLGVGFLADNLGLSTTFKICGFVGLGMIPVTIFYLIDILKTEIVEFIGLKY